MTAKELNIALYKTLYLIRQSEVVIQEEYFNDEMKTPMHMSMGSEAIATGVCATLSKEDQVLGTYRSHALYIAKTNELTKFFAEMYGKSSGAASGKAGSMHISAPEHGLMCCSAIVASSVSVAVGVALANKMQRLDRWVVSFIGDGATSSGAFWESLNFACLHQLQIIFIIENNQLAIHTEADAIFGFDDVLSVSSQYRCKTYRSSSTDVEEIYHLINDVKNNSDHHKRPAVVELNYHRYLEHVGVNEDYQDGYRSKADAEHWLALDPIKLQRDKLIERNHLTENELIDLEKYLLEKINSAHTLAIESVHPDSSSLYHGVFA